MNAAKFDGAFDYNSLEDGSGSDAATPGGRVVAGNGDGAGDGVGLRRLPPRASSSARLVHGAAVARFTTFALVPDAGGGGFAGTAAAVDAIFARDILPAAPLKEGYVDCVRLLDARLDILRSTGVVVD